MTRQEDRLDYIARRLTDEGKDAAIDLTRMMDMGMAQESLTIAAIETGDPSEVRARIVTGYQPRWS